MTILGVTLHFSYLDPDFIFVYIALGVLSILAVAFLFFGLQKKKDGGASGKKFLFATPLAIVLIAWAVAFVLPDNLSDSGLDSAVDDIEEYYGIKLSESQQDLLKADLKGGVGLNGKIQPLGNTTIEGIGNVNLGLSMENWRSNRIGESLVGETIAVDAEVSLFYEGAEGYLALPKS